MLKPWWMIERSFAPEDGTGSGAGEGEGDGAGAPPAFSWGDEIDEDLKGFIGDRSPLDVAKDGLAHKQGATRRREQIVDELGADEDFIKSFSEKHGLGAMPKDDAEFIAMAKGRIAEDAEYKAPKIEGADENLTGAWASAARKSGVAPGQFTEFMKEAAAEVKAKSEAAAEKLNSDLKTEWDDDYDEKTAQINTFLNQVGEDLGGDMLSILSLFPPAAQKRAAGVLADLGARIGSAEQDGPGGASGGSSSGSGDAAADWEAARKVLQEKGNQFEKLTPSERDEYERAYEAFKASKGKG